MYDGRNRLSDDVMKNFANFPNQNFSLGYSRNVRLAEAPSFGKPISRMTHGQRQKAYERLARKFWILKVYKLFVRGHVADKGSILKFECSTRRLSAPNGHCRSTVE